MRVRLLYVTEMFPYGPGEAFLISELKELISRHIDLLIIPLNPQSSVIHQDATQFIPLTHLSPRFAFKFLSFILKEALNRPLKSLSVLGWLRHCRSYKVFLRNLRVYPKGFWLAQIVRHWNATHIHANFAVSSSTIAMIASELTGIPWSLTIHRYDIVENDLLPLKIRKSVFARFISNNGLNLAASLGIKINPFKTHVLHMGVELPYLPSLPNKENTLPVIICPANLIPVKGHKYLIEAVFILKKRGINVSLLLAGQGMLYKDLKRQVDELDLNDRIKFLGHISHNELLKYYQFGSVDIVVLPSVDLGNGVHEGIPVSLIEAMSYGIPVISTRTGGIPELLADEAGLLIDPQDSSGLADAISAILSDQQLRKQLSVSGRKRVEDMFNNKIIIDKFLNLIGNETFRQ